MFEDSAPDEDGEYRVFGGPLDGSTIVVLRDEGLVVLEKYISVALTEEEDVRIPHGRSQLMRVASYAYLPVKISEPALVDPNGGKVIGVYRIRNGKLRWFQQP